MASHRCRAFPGQPRRRSRRFDRRRSHPLECTSSRSAPVKRRPLPSAPLQTARVPWSRPLRARRRVCSCGNASSTRSAESPGGLLDHLPGRPHPRHAIMSRGLVSSIVAWRRAWEPLTCPGQATSIHRSLTQARRRTSAVMGWTNEYSEACDPLRRDQDLLNYLRRSVRTLHADQFVDQVARADVRLVGAPTRRGIRAEDPFSQAQKLDQNLRLGLQLFGCAGDGEPS